MKQTILLTLLFPFFALSQTVTTLVDSAATNFSDDIILDDQGNLYCSDYGGTSIFKRTPTGQISVFATGFNTPNGLAFDSQGNLFVADNVGNRIYKLSNTGQFLDTIQVTNPSGIIKMPNSDTLIFTQYMPHNLSKLAPDGTIQIIHAGTPLNGPVGLTYDENQNLFLANYGNGNIYQVTMSDTASFEFITTVPILGATNNVVGFIEYAQGFLWATSFNLNKIYRIDPVPNGNVYLVAGSTIGSVDGDAASAKFNRPNGICASITGDSLYISDYGTGNLRVISDYYLTTSEIPVPIQLNSAPNPVSTTATLSWSTELKAVTMEIYSAEGRLIHTEEKVNGNNYTLDFTRFSPGNYHVRLVNDQVDETITIIKGE